MKNNKYFLKMLSLSLTLAIISLNISSIAFASDEFVTPIGTSSIVAPQPDSGSLALPTVEQIHSKGEYARFMEGEWDLNELTANDLLLTIAQAAYEFELNGTTPEELEGFVPATYATLLPVMRDEDFVLIVSNKDYPVSLRWYMLDFYNAFSPKLSHGFETTLINITTDETESDLLRSYAVTTFSNATGNGSELLENLYTQVSDDFKPMLLKSMFLDHPSIAKEIATTVMQDYTSENISLVALANKVLAHTLASSEEKQQYFDLNRQLLQSENIELAEHSLYALAEMKSADAVSLVFEVADFDNFGIKGFVEKNFKLVSNYLDTASFSDIEKCVMAVPLPEFKSYLTDYNTSSRNIAKDEASLLQMYAAVEAYNAKPTIDSKAIASGFQGFAGYRDGVCDIDNVTSGFWHGGIVNSVDAAGTDAYIQSSGYFRNVKPVDEDVFLDGQSFMGLRKAGPMTQRERNNVLTTARELTGYGVSYCFGHLMTANISGMTDDLDIIYPEQIRQMRCDGLVEYCFEYNGMRLQGTSTEPNSWDICTKLGFMTGHVAIRLTPYTQYSSPYFTW